MSNCICNISILVESLDKIYASFNQLRDYIDGEMNLQDDAWRPIAMQLDNQLSFAQAAVDKARNLIACTEVVPNES